MGTIVADTLGVKLGVMLIDGVIVGVGVSNGIIIGTHGVPHSEILLFNEFSLK